MPLKNYCLITIILILSCTTTSRAVLDPEDENYFEHTADRYDWSNHPCRRNCSFSERSKLCEYVFVVEQYSTMSKACYDCPYNLTDCSRPHCLAADGQQKIVYTANRLMPGPPIEVCVDDVISVEIRNNMLSESTTIHWHGIRQIGTQYMDGVPHVTQCPILPGERFRYSFNANISGTYFWHSHIGSQRSTGLFGPLIVRSSPRQNLHHKLYDYDVHTMIIIDWNGEGGTEGFVKLVYTKPPVRPDTILVNGLGRYKGFQTNNETDAHYTPVAVFNVTSNKRYRFRLINAGASSCSITVSIDNHTLHVISLDSNDIEPVEVDVITTWPGERVDFVLSAGQKPDNYWIRYRGFGIDCSASNSTNGVYQVAILRYENSSSRDPSSPIGYDYPKYANDTRVLNPFNGNSETSQMVNVSIPLLNALAPNDPSLKPVADQQVHIAFDFYELDNYDFHRKDLYGYNQVASDSRIGTLQLNHISFKFPKFPLLSQREMIGPNSFCNSSHPPENLNCTAEQCVCTHVIQLKLNSVVEIFFIDQGAFGIVMNHPLHLHGHFFRVISEENIDGVVTIDRIKQLDKEGKIKRRLNRAPIKDTMKIPSGGYTIIRVYADNPGYWYFHCHFEEHTNMGMDLVFKIGEHENFPTVPKGFPTCGGFLPTFKKVFHV